MARSLDGLMCTRLHVKGAAEIILDLCTQQVGPACRRRHRNALCPMLAQAE